INQQLASTPKYRQQLSKIKQIIPYMHPPFVLETVMDENPANTKTDESGDTDVENAEAQDADGEETGMQKKKAPKLAKRKSLEPEVVEKTNARDLFEYVKEAGSRGYEKTR